ncbi:hypothetical protein N7507_004631 [Penicillium longicatenatum]|nr:hypothetical protein N7507_004631 [Penicillium longicatenatum]
MIYCQVVDPMFLMTAIQFGVQGVKVPPNVIQIAETYHRWTVASLMLSWCAISLVKFFFLVFFKRLIDRLRPWQIYWWIVFGYNVVLVSFGITVYYASCPFWGTKALQCATGVYKASLVRYSAAQISLDIVGELLRIIWKIQVDWRQKLVLACSLCLTIVLVALSITRVAGLNYKGFVDSVWETFWLMMSAELSVFLAAASAFRAFFVAQQQSKAYNPGYNQGLRSPQGKAYARSDPKQHGNSSDVDSYRRLKDPEWNITQSTTISTETEMVSIP